MPPKARKEDEIDPIELFKMKRLLKNLEDSKGDGTSMVTILIPPGAAVFRMRQKLVEELGTASNIKNRVNRQSVETAITSAIQKLSLYNQTPPNGLCIFCGTVLDNEGKEKKLMIDLEPFRPLQQSLYICDRRFHTDPLQGLLQTNEKFGFIIMDGQSTLFGLVAGNSRQILYKFSVDLPKKHNKGGQSSIRFARLRLEARHNYVHKVAELAVQHYIPDGAEPNVTGLILAGSADFKNVLSQSDLFDIRLRTIVLGIYDICYGGEEGFNQTIKMSADLLKDVRLVREQELIQKLLDMVATGGSCAFGIKETMLAYDAGAIDTLIMWEDLKTFRCVMKNDDGEESIQYYTQYQLEKNEHLAGSHCTLADKVLLTEWMAENHKQKGCKLEFVTDRSPEGAQFIKGLSGIGAMLRFQMGFEEYKDGEGANEGFDDGFDEFEDLV